MTISGIDELVRQAQAFTEQLARLKQELARETVLATAGGGMVRVEADGRGRIVRVEIEPGVVDPAEVEMLQDLITAAINLALEKAKELAVEKVQSLAGGLPIPGLEGLLV